jgi:hypothetical protein
MSVEIIENRARSLRSIPTVEDYGLHNSRRRIGDVLTMMAWFGGGGGYSGVCSFRIKAHTMTAGGQ